MRRTGRLRPIAWFTIGIAMLVWSLLAWTVYVFIDPIFTWLATSLDVVVDQGKGIAKTVGSKAVEDILSQIDTSTLPGQILKTLRVAGKPLIIGIWVLGVLAMVVGTAGLVVGGRSYYRDHS